jgi:hypothetical protein
MNTPDPVAEAWARAAVAAMLLRVRRALQIEYLQRLRELR